MQCFWISQTHVKCCNLVKAKRVRTMKLSVCCYQRWSPRGRPWPRGRPRGQILKSLALASRPQVLENWPVLGSRTAVFFELLKFCGALEKFFRKRFFVEIAWKIFVKTFFFFGDRLKNFCEDLFFSFFLESTCACVLGPWPWPRAFLSLASRVSVLGKAVLGLGLGFFLCPWPWPWPWPRALCPRLHLWLLRHTQTLSGKFLFWILSVELHEKTLGSQNYAYAFKKWNEHRSPDTAA